MALKKILIVAEKADTADWKKSILARAEFEVLVAHSSEEALEIHRREKSSLMVIDLGLGGRKGEQLCRDIRADEALRNVSIIAIGSAPSVEMARFSQCGANEFLLHPLNQDIFQRAISNLIEVSPRMNCRALFQGSVTGHLGAEGFFAVSRNLSRSGILISTTYPMKKNDIFECSFVLPDIGEVFVKAEVVRLLEGNAGEFLYGSRFIVTSDRDMQYIDTFLKKESECE